MTLLGCVDRSSPPQLDNQPNKLSSIRKLKECLTDTSEHIEAWHKRLFTPKQEHYTELQQKLSDINLPATGDLVCCYNLNHKENH